jgi:hypothetical protein
MLSSFCSICNTLCLTLVTNLVISPEWGKNHIVIMTIGTYPWSFLLAFVLSVLFRFMDSYYPFGIFKLLWHRYSLTVNQVMMTTVKHLKWWLGPLGSVAFLLAATLYHGNHDRNHKLWNIGKLRDNILHMEVLLEYWCSPLRNCRPKDKLLGFCTAWNF